MTSSKDAGFSPCILLPNIGKLQYFRNHISLSWFSCGSSSISWSNWILEILVFLEGGKRKIPEKSLRARREQTTNSTHMTTGRNQTWATLEVVPAPHDLLPVTLSSRCVSGVKLAVTVPLFTYTQEASNIWSTACIGPLPVGSTRILNTYRISLSLSWDVEEQFPTSKLVYVTVSSENVGWHSSLSSIRQSLSLNASRSITFMMVMVTVWSSLHKIEPVGEPVKDKSWRIFAYVNCIFYISFLCVGVACVKRGVRSFEGRRTAIAQQKVAMPRKS